MHDLNVTPPGTVSAELMQRVERKLDECMEMIPQPLTRPFVVYDLRGKHAGYANNTRIRLNADLLNDPRYVDNMIDDTVVHEFAHVVVRQLYPGSQSHGETWKAVMRRLGIERPQRCHDYEVVPARTHARMLYVCGCQEHWVTKITHNRIKRGITYTCRQCKGVLTWPHGGNQEAKNHSA